MWSPSLLLPLIAAVAPAPPDSANVVTIVAHDYALQMPDSIPAGLTTFRLENRGAEYHIAAFARLAPGKTLADYMAELRADTQGPTWATDVGGPGPIMPGQDGRVTIALTPGRYVVLCDITSKDHVEHWKKGMIRMVTVTPASRTATPPESDITITLVDYAFQVSTPITPGVHVIKVVNGASQSHMLAVMRFAPGKTIEDAAKWDHQSPNPVLWSAGTTGIAPGVVTYLRERFSPGDYGLFCFNDAPDGKTHAEHGMQAMFTVR